MTVTIHGELTADRNSIVLIAAGPVEEIAHAAKMLGTLTPLIKASEPKGALIMPATWPGVVQLSATYGPAWQPGPRLLEWTREQAAARTTNLCSELTAPIPDGLTPWPHQVEGARIIAATGRALIFDEPRTGKTITTILGLVELQHRGKLVGPILVVCPASVVDPWLEAIEDWAPQWRAAAWSGPKRTESIGRADVLISSYELVVKDAKDTNPKRSPLVALDPRAVVVDECHMTKTPDSKRSQAVRRVARNAHAFVALSGTPITHHPANLWPTLVSFAPGAWPSRERWVGRYCLTVPAVDYGETILGLHPGTEPEFRLTLLGQHRRAARADLGWAPKSYEVRTVELPEEYRKAYDEFEADMLAELPDGQELSVMDTLSQLSFLRRLACSAADVEVTVEVVEDAEGNLVEKRHVSLHHKWPSWKIDELVRILVERGGRPTVAFAVSKPLAMMAGEAAEKIGLRVGYVVGGQTRKRRTETRKAFQRGELDLVCATVGAGGVGITLNRAKDLVFIERPWSLVESIQAEDRGVGDINAPGCHVIDILANRTIDTRVRAVLRERAGQLADLVQDPRIVAELLGGATVTRLANRKAS
jgi:hypothetical protein